MMSFIHEGQKIDFHGTPMINFEYSNLTIAEPFYQVEMTIEKLISHARFYLKNEKAVYKMFGGHLKKQYFIKRLRNRI